MCFSFETNFVVSTYFLYANRIKYFREPFPVNKCIKAELIIAMISRGLAVNCLTLSTNLIIDNIALGALLPQIHVSLFGVLNKFIVA